MKIRRIEVEAFRKFRKPVFIDGLQEGLNLLYGPNEAGKSTIARAIRVAFFERHGVGGETVKADMRPVDMPDAAPRVRIEFELGDQTGFVAKTFLKQARSELVIGDKSWNGEGADVELAQRLGFSFAGKGASAPVHQGIPGLLWIAQGECVELASRVEAARQTLRERLAPVLGELTTSSGSALLAQLERHLYELETTEGKPRGSYKESVVNLEHCEAAWQGLAKKADAFRADSDALAQAHKERKSLEAERPWEELERKLEAVSLTLQTAESRRQQLEALNKSKTLLEDRIAELQRQKDTRTSQLAKLAANRSALQRLGEDAEPAAGALTKAQQVLEQAQKAREGARQALRQANLLQERQRRERENARAKDDLTRIQKVVGSVEELQTTLNDLRKQLATVALDPKDVAALTQSESDLREANIRRDAVATRVGYVLQPGVTIGAGARGTLSGDGEFQINHPIEMVIPDVGTLRIVPGGENVDELESSSEALSARVEQLRLRLGVSDGAVARAQLDTFKDVQQQIKALERQRAQLLDGSSIEAWRENIVTIQATIDGHEKRLLELADLPDIQITPGQADRNFEAADAAVREAQQRETTAKEACDRNALDIRGLSDQVAADAERLEGTEATDEAAKRDETLQEHLNEQEQLRQSISFERRAIEELRPEVLKDDEQRLKQSLKSVNASRSELSARISGLQNRLDVLGLDGVDERASEARLAMESAQQRRDQLHLRADALRLLCHRLRDHQQQATERLFAPLLSKLQRYLALLFPDATTQMVVEDLETTAMRRDGIALALDDYSYGTREQIAVLARLAYADLLQEAGFPTLLMLDDALVHSDVDRREQMKRVLFDAAKRHQILLFTCRRSEWVGAGARQEIDIGSLGETEAG